MTLISSSLSLMNRRELNDGWTVHAASGPVSDRVSQRSVPAIVPGVVHLDLMAAGLIPDPYLDDNESALAWIGLVDWTYELTFSMDADELAQSDRHELVFDGLDTVATVLLNGQTIAQVANQHRSYRFDVTELLRVGENGLTVAFRSPVRYANAESVKLGARPRPYSLPYEAIRKSACSFGWDWGIATYASGIWKPVRIESWSLARLATVQIQALPDGDGGRVHATVVVDRTVDTNLSVELRVEEVASTLIIPAGEREAVVSLTLESVERWWPVGYGEQALYDVSVELSADDRILDSASRRVGFRSVAWNTTPDGAGTPFQLEVNGQPVLVKGVNWIPDDAFPSRVDRARYERRLTQARDANINLIRVWGGGIYESEDFYDVCDELGLLTWQDFLFACAAYPEEEPLRSEVEAEAREVVARLGYRASLVLLTGNNENLWGFEDWAWKARLDGKTWGAYYYHDLFPRVISEIAPTVPYSPGSPFSPDAAHHPNDELNGSMHLWEQWNRRDWPTYAEHTPRFVAEFGWQGPPTWSTMTRSISDQPLTPESPGMIVHQKAMGGNAKLTSGLVPHFRVPEDVETWHWAMQLNQAYAVGFALDHFRSHWPHTSGAIVWQLNDCWPVTSWAAIDGDGHEKPLLWAITKSFAPRVVSLHRREDGVVAAVGNDTSAQWSGELVVALQGFDGAEYGAVTLAVDVPPRSMQEVAIPQHLLAPDDAASTVLMAAVGAVRGYWYFAEPRDSALVAPQLSASVEQLSHGFALTITAANFVRDLTLLIDKIDPLASVDGGLVTLRAGESCMFTVRGVSTLDVAAVLAPEVARSANQLVVR
ncbi:Beta-mannosidase [Leifsonia rubra CMS 76R]|nr:Beta-mannosidase [Leifsonia rubra CMS 76R]